MSSFQPKFFDKATLIQMNVDLSYQHEQLSDRVKALHAEKSSICRKLEEVNDALAEVELEIQNRPHSQPLPHTRGDTSSSPSPPTDIPLISHESDYTILDCSSLAMSEASHMAVVDDVGFQFEQHQHFSGNHHHHGIGHYAGHQDLRTGRRHSDALHQQPSRNAQMRLNAFLEVVQLPNEYPTSSESSQHLQHQRKLSTASTSENEIGYANDFSSRSYFPSVVDARRATSNPTFNSAFNQHQIFFRNSPGLYTDPATSSEMNPPLSSDGGGTQEGRSGTLAFATAGSSGSAIGGQSTMLPPNPLGEEILPDSPVLKVNSDPPTTNSTHPFQHADIVTIKPTTATPPITAKECADTSAAYRYGFQLPHIWKHLGESLQVCPPVVSLYHYRIISSSPQPSIGSRQESLGSGSPDGEGSRTQSGLDAVVRPSTIGRGGGGGRRIHSTTPPPQNERPGHGCNVHDALQRRYGPEMFSYYPYLIHETEIENVKQRAENYQSKYPSASPTVFYVQMFPTELISVGGRVMESVVREVAGDDTGVVIGCIAVTFNAVRATILTASPFKLCHALRCRVMADRHGFWYARTYEAFLALREYCSNLRYISQQERHYITDGLASIPLIVEFATEVNIPSLGLPCVGHEPYDFILGRDPNHKTTFPFERPKVNSNNVSPPQHRDRGVDQPTTTKGGLGSDVNVANATPTSSTRGLGVDGEEITLTTSTTSVTSATLLVNSTSIAVGAGGQQHSPSHPLHSSTTAASSSPPNQPFNPNSRPRPPNEILQHYVKLQAKLTNILKGRNRTRGGAQHHLH